MAQGWACGQFRGHDLAVMNILVKNRAVTQSLLFSNSMRVINKLNATIKPWRSTIGAWLTLALMLLLYACGNPTLRVGELRRRVKPAPDIGGIELELIATQRVDGSPDPVWSPDGRHLVFSSSWGDEVFHFDTQHQKTRYLYTSDSPSPAYRGCRDSLLQYCFINKRELFAILDGREGDGLIIDVLNNSVEPTLPEAYHCHPSNFEHALKETWGTVDVLDPYNRVVAEHPSLSQARWSSDGKGFFALLQKDQNEYDGRPKELVYVNAPLQDQATLQVLESRVLDYELAPNGEGLVYLDSSLLFNEWDRYEPYRGDWAPLYYHEFENSRSIKIAEKASFPRFLGDSQLLLYNSPDGLMINNFQQSKRLFSERLNALSIGPDGQYLVGGIEFIGAPGCPDGYIMGVYRIHTHQPQR